VAAAAAAAGAARHLRNDVEGLERLLHGRHDRSSSRVEVAVLHTHTHTGKHADTHAFQLEAAEAPAPAPAYLGVVVRDIRVELGVRVKEEDARDVT